MNLVIDRGNTLIKAAIFEKAEPVYSIKTDDINQLRSFINQYPYNQAILASVGSNPERISKLVDKARLHILNTDSLLPFNNKYKTARTLGADRIAGIAGAIAMFPGKPVLVVDAGTCVTYDFADQDGNYYGGAISPGLLIRFKALNTFTASLPLVSWDSSPVQLVGENTEESILSGVINGLIEEVRGICSQYRSRFKDIQLVFTGGDAKLFETTIKEVIFVVPDLTLRGLNRILEFNR
ncbi:MAG: type III pantothenate kinase [Cytophagaceae bacterium]